MKKAIFIFIGLLVFNAQAGIPFGFWKKSGTPAPTPDLMWYKFTEGSGTTTADSTGNGHTGTLVSSPTWTTGPTSHGALQFASGGKVTFSGPATGTTFTLSMWVFPIPTSSAYGNLFAQGSTKGLYYKGSATGAKKIDYFDSTDGFNTTTLTDNAWTQIAVVVTAGSATFYVNGASDGTRSSVTTMTPNTMGSDTSSESFNGKVADVELFSTALSGAQIAAIYNAGAN